MGDEDRRHRPLRGKILHQRGEGAAQGGVERRERLVEQQRVAVREQQAAERHPVPLAAGQPGGHRREQPVDPERGGDLGQLDARRPTPPAGPSRPRVGQVGADRQVREQPRDPAAAARPAAPTAAPRPRASRWRSAPARPARPARDAGATRPAITSSTVVLPAPDGPNSATRSPSATSSAAADGEVAAVSLDVDVQHARSRRRRPAAAAAPPPAGPGRTGARCTARSPAGW